MALAAILLVLLAACAPSLPLVIVDEAHFTAFKHGEIDEAYEVTPGPGLRLDATGYPFLIPAEAPAVPGPNMVQITTSDGQVYSHPWDMRQTVYELTPDTLASIETGEAFPGLEAGDSYLLGVGYLDASGRFTVLWASVLNVTS
jgi:hypothetical protein